VIVHAGLVARRAAGRWRGVLIEGPSGSGKSDLALRLLQAGWRLVADDRVMLWMSGDRLYGRAPAALHGLLEARGVDVFTAPALPLSEVVLTVRHTADPERLPEPRRHRYDAVDVPLLALNLIHAATPARVALAWAQHANSDARPHRLDSAVT
jgi:serine kinase of HPr protein (carbohydrate metabolism regulator)